MMTRPKVILCSAAAILFVIVATMCAFHEDDFVIVIDNNSAFVLTDVEVNGDGAWTQQVPPIPSGAKTRVLVNQDFGDSGLGIRFFANGTEVAKGDVAYVVYGGRGTTATFTVLKDLGVNATYDGDP